ncbi:hypothetical protein ES288_A06G226700v1, partial [Gossypium darwinii]
FENFLLRGWDFIVGHANYVCKLKQTLPTLSAALQELRALRNDVQREVDVADQRLLKPFERVQLWLSTADTMITEAENLVSHGPQQMNNLCLGGCISENCLSSYKFGKRVAEMLQEISDHKMVVRPLEQPVALESTIQKVWSCIEDKDVGIIGLYGLGGVGKTTLLTQINNKFGTTGNDFKVVIWALVSKDYDVGKIQDRIGENIGFLESWKNKSVDQKAVDIYGILSNKRFVVLLVDLWERMDLNQVGIPKPSQENGSKLIFTTRYLEVCGEMGARKKIKVECLEPWELFQDKVGDETLNSHPDIPNLAKQVAERCGGLPLSLITIGRAMACKTTLGEWKYAIEMLKRCALPKMENEVFPLLKFSYDNLPDVTMKCCLLYCCLHPEDYCIPKKRLVEYWFCEGLLNQFDRISDAQMQGDYIVNSLLSACLLERDGEYSVKMHDVILLKETPKCPNLRTLFLGQNELKVISNGFFQFIPHLTVLDLSRNFGLRVLPKGISELISLECLDLSATFIEELPIELKLLTKLKMLDLSYMHNLRKIPRQLISNFVKLQIFRIGRLGNGDYGVDNVLSWGMEKLIEELKGLHHLNILSITIKSMISLERFLSFNLFRCCTQALELRDFGVLKVFNVLCLENLEHLETLEFLDCESMKEIKMEKLHPWVFSSTNHTSRFHTLSTVRIFECNKLRDMTWLILAPNLSYIGIFGCKKMEEILSERKLDEVTGVTEISYPKPFLKLETLHLFRLPKLKSIYWNALPFPRLKHIHIFGCRGLKKLPLNSDSAKGNLLTIEGSKHWWARVEWEKKATQYAFLPSFKPLASFKPA